MSCNPNYVRYIPPVDTPCYSPYAGCYRVSPPVSFVPNSMRTNPRCPMSICPPCAGRDCKCKCDNEYECENDSEYEY